MLRPRGFLSIVAAAFLAAPPVCAGQYSQDFNSFTVGGVPFGDGSSLYSSALGIAARIEDPSLKELQLIQWDVANTRSAFLLPDLDPSNRVYSFSATWLSPVYGDFPNAAEGFSFSFVGVPSLDLTNTGFNQESGYGAPVFMRWLLRLFTEMLL